ncbi:MAG: choice-of-anchor tandem repeat NxxGxxAF-containing protein [Planctomycetota bacterium]
MAAARNASLWTTTLTLMAAQAAGQAPSDVFHSNNAGSLSAGSAQTIPGVAWLPALAGQATGMVIDDACATALIGFATRSDEESAVPAVWHRSPQGEFTPIAVAGEPAFGLARFGQDFSRLAILPDGSVTFSVELVYDHITTRYPYAHFRFADGELRPIALNGQAVGTGDDVLISLLHTPTWDVASNTVSSAFFAGLDSPYLAAGDRPIFTQTGDGPARILVREGDVPIMERATTPFVVLGGVSSAQGMNRHLAMNSFGETVFSAIVHDAGTGEFGSGIWIDRRMTGLERIAGAGDIVGDDVRLNTFDPLVTVNAAGVVGFVATLDGEDVTAFDNEAVFLAYADGQLLPLVRKGGAAPGTLPAAVFHRFNDVALADTGAAMVSGTVTAGIGTPAQHGFWTIDRQGSVLPVVVTGGPALDMEEGVTISGVVSHAFGDAGHLAFVATVEGFGVEAGMNDLALYQTDDLGRPVLVARTGFGLEYAPGTDEPTQVVTGLLLESASRGDDGLPSAVNRLGDTVFTVTFADGTGSTMVATPPEANAADVNRDGLVNPADFTAWVQAFNREAIGCDQNGDGACAPDDFSAWIVNFNAALDR